MFPRKASNCHLKFISKSLLVCVLLTSIATVTLSHAEVTLDGTLGPSGPVGSGTLPDGTLTDYLITHDLGRQANSNLFHSFGKFSIETGRSATFTGPPAIENIIGRVTGGELSRIDGLLRSTIDGANLYLLNPAGIFFGPNAELDVRGSFHASTADYLRFRDGEKFYADPAQTSVLSVAPPEAFGFLSANPAGITIDQSLMEVQPGETMSMVGGDIKATGASLLASSGRINMASVASAGEVIPNLSGQPHDLKVDSFASLGQIDLTQDALLDTGSGSGGKIVIRGGQLMVIATNIYADTLGDLNGSQSGIDMKITGAAVLTDGSYVTTDVFGAGNAGQIQVAADSLEVSNGAVLGSRAFSGSTGDTGNVAVMAGNVRVTSSGRIESRTYSGSSGNAGVVAISADNLDIDGGSVRARTAASGSAGTIDLQVKQLNVTNSGEILADTYFTSSTGQGGSVNIVADALNVDDGYIQTVTRGKGNAGRIDLQVEQLDVTNGGQISASARSGSTGQAGAITITATDSVTISGEDSAGNDSGLYSSTEGIGNAGTIALDVGSMSMTDGARISTSSFGGGTGGNLRITARESVSISGSCLYGRAYSEGKAGSIAIDVESLSINNRAQIDTSSRGTAAGGDLRITAESFSLNDSELFSRAESEGNAGAISLDVGNLILSDDAKISTSSLGAGDGGEVRIAATSVSMSASDVYSQAESSGNGGEIFLDVGTLTLSNGAEINCDAAESSSTGRAGSIQIKADGPIVISGRRGGWGSLPRSGISNETWGSGKAGTISLFAPTLILDDDGIISSKTWGVGRGGEIFLDVGTLTLTNGSDISCETLGAGHGGNIMINAAEFVYLSRGHVEADTWRAGDGGMISISTPRLMLDNFSWITSHVKGSGRGGDIFVAVGTLELTNGGQIESDTDLFGGSGPPGDITVAANESVLVSGRFSEISSVTRGPRDGGTVSIRTPSLILEDGATMAVDTAVAETTPWDTDHALSHSGNGGDILLDVGTLTLRNGAEINCRSYSSGKGGNVTIAAAELVSISDSEISGNSYSDGDSGLVSISTPTLILDEDGEILVYTTGAGRGGEILANVGNLTMTGGARISADTGSEGDGGDIRITAESIYLSDSSVSCSARDEGNGGTIFLDVGTLTLIDGGQIKVHTSGGGDGGRVTVSARDSISVSGRDLEHHPSGFRSDALSEGKGGDIFLDVGSLTITDVGQISASSQGSGHGGTVTISARDLLTISGGDPKGYPSGIFNIAEGEGNAGGISLDAGILTLTGGAQISVHTRGSGDGGDMSVRAESVSISGYVHGFDPDPGIEFQSGGSSGLYSGTFSDGVAGDILIQAGQVRLNSRGKISAQSTGSGNGGSVQITTLDTIQTDNSSVTTAAEQGAGGDIAITSQNAQLFNESVVSAKSSGRGDAGDIVITARDTLLLNDSSITTEAIQADGGNIKINNDYMVLIGESEIRANVGGGPETVGGNIFIDPEFVILRNSNILANAFEGRGGNIRIVAGTFLADPNCIVDASSEKGIDGTVDIRAPIKDVSQSVSRLPEEYLSAAELLREECIARIHGGKYSTFVVTGRDGLPHEPGGLLPSPLYEE